MGVDCAAMRALIFAILLLVSTPAHSAVCKFYNRSGQSLEWLGESLIIDPLYMDAYVCPLEPIPNTDAYKATCGTWSETLVVGYADNPQHADALVWQDIFYWRKCINNA